MLLGPRLLELVLRAPSDHLQAMIAVMLENLLQVHLARHAVVERQQNRSERRLQVGALVELVQHGGGIRAALQLDGDAQSVAVGLVTEIGHLVELLRPHQLDDLLHDLSLRHTIGDLRDYQLLLAAAQLLALDARAHDDPPAAGPVRVLDSVPTDDEGARGEVGPGHPLHQLLHLAVRIVGEVAHGRSDLPQVVRRHVGAHADGDPRAPVYQQIRQSCGKHVRLLPLPVERVGEVHGVALEIDEQLLGDARELRFRIAVGRGVVPVDAAEIPLTIHQRVTQTEALDHAHQRVVHCRIAVRMVFSQDFTDDGRALLVGPRGRQPELRHRVQNPPVHRLEAVAHVRKRPLHDDAHRVVDERFPHLLFDEPRHHPFPLLRHDHTLILPFRDARLR